MNKILIATEILLMLICKMESTKPFELLLLHTNNINFHFDEDESNIGGAGRALYMLKKFREETRHSKGPPVLYLNAGDNFARVRSHSEDEWELIAEYLNLLQPDAMCLGNHDLDLTLSTLEKFLSTLRIPVVGSNIEFDRVEGLQELVKPFHVLTVENHEIGIVGVTTSRTRIPGMSSRISITNEIEAVQRECSKLHEMGVRIIIVLSHSGYDVDETIARAVDHVDVIVSGHKEPSKGKYSASKQVIKGKNKRHVPIIYEEGDMRYLGMLKLYFNEVGDLTQFNGEPILLHNKLPAAEEVLQIGKRSKRSVENILGMSRTPMTAKCQTSECNLGNLITDALVDQKSYVYKLKSKASLWWTNYPIAIINAGIVRRRFVKKGPVSASSLVRSMYYYNTVVHVRIQGQHIMRAIEQGLNWYGKRNRGFLQFSGLRVTLNMTKEGENRISRVSVRCGTCTWPAYHKMLRKEVYNVIVNEYLYSGLDGVTAFKDNKIDYKPVDESVGFVVQQYVSRKRTITSGHDKRLIVYSGSQKFNPIQSVLFMLILIYNYYTQLIFILF